MATVKVGGLNPSTTTIDQQSYVSDPVSIEAALLTFDSTVTVTNTTGITTALDLSQTFTLGLVATQTLNLEENVHVKLASTVGIGVGSTLNYNLADGATLEISSAALNVGLLNTTNINMGAGSSTLIYDASTLNVDISFTPNLTGITDGDQIQVQGATTGEYVGGQLVFKNANNIVVGRFNAPDLDPTLINFNNGSMSYACYLKGTNIATPEGEVKVEDLKAGDKVLSARGNIATVKWVGYRTLRKARIPAKDAIRAFPITFKKDSVATNIPHRDVSVSPHHLVLIDGSLIPAMVLVNGQTITQDFANKAFQYFHVELDSFDILLADGLPAESYVDMGNRSMFENADTVDLHPNFDAPKDGSRPELEGITVQRSGAAVEAVRKKLLKRAESMTQAKRVSNPDLRVEINGQEIRAEEPGQIEGVMRFILPAGTQASDLRILSRSAVVRDTTPYARRDLRQIGVGLSSIVIEDAAGRREIDITDSQLTGLHPSQDIHGVTMRWTNGTAVIPAAVHHLNGEAVLELTVLRTYTYWQQAQKRAA
jgi:hypothetical protein